MKDVYRGLAFLIAAGVFVQAGSIAYGWFQVISEVEAGAVMSADSPLNAGHEIHGTVGMMVLPILGLLFLIVSFFARFRGAVRWAAIVFGLIVLQVVLAFVAFGVPLVGALHGMNALAILGAAISAGVRVRRVAVAEVGAEAHHASV